VGYLNKHAYDDVPYRERLAIWAGNRVAFHWMRCLGYSRGQAGTMLNISRERARVLDDEANGKRKRPPRFSRVLVERPDQGPLDVRRFNFSCRVVGMLEAEGIHTLDQLCKYSASDLLKMRNFGRVSLSEVRVAMSGVGLRFNQRYGNGEGRGQEGHGLLHDHQRGQAVR
jgi:hypothetical protein